MCPWQCGQIPESMPSAGEALIQAFAEIVMPLEREYEADLSEPLAAALAAVGAPLKEVVPFDDLDREMGWDKPDAADRLDTPAMET